MKVVVFMNKESYVNKAEKVVKYDDKKEGTTFYKVVSSYKKHDTILKIENSIGVKLSIACMLNALQLNKRIEEQLKIRLYSQEQKEQYIIDNASRSKCIALQYKTLKE